MKYIDSLSDITLKTFGTSYRIVDRLYTSELYEALDSDIATIVTSLGMAYFANPRIQVTRRD
jgi:hypothetical protein